MKKIILLISCLILSVNATSQINVSSLKGLVPAPVEKKFKAYFIEKNNNSKGLKFKAIIEDPNNLLSKFDLSKKDVLSYIYIEGSEKVKTIEEADLIYRLEIKGYSF